MILYKYASLPAAQAIIANNRIGFSRANFFNDPFDTPLAVPESTKNPIEEAFANIGAWAKSKIWEEKSGILSLTRTATNPLMWAHYADQHRGAVLAIDTKAATFLDVQSNMIPAHFGSVVYSRRRIAGPYHSTFSTPVVVGATHGFVLDHYEKWQRLFLNKPLDWAYEEEVRVVKCLDGIDGGLETTASGTFTVQNLEKRQLHCFHLPEGAICGIYVGARVEKGAMQNLKDSLTMPIHRAKLHEHVFAMTFEQIN